MRVDRCWGTLEEKGDQSTSRFYNVGYTTKQPELEVLGGGRDEQQEELDAKYSVICSDELLHTITLALHKRTPSRIPGEDILYICYQISDYSNPDLEYV